MATAVIALHRNPARGIRVPNGILSPRSRVVERAFGCTLGSDSKPLSRRSRRGRFEERVFERVSSRSESLGSLQRLSVAGERLTERLLIRR